MDTFTDVDLLSEVLDAAARRVPVYILLDEMNAQLFLDMAAKCKVNLNYVDVSRTLDVAEGGGWGRSREDAACPRGHLALGERRPQMRADPADRQSSACCFLRVFQ